MNKHRKTWSVPEKLEVINFEKKNGCIQASREYGVSCTSIYKWKSQYEDNREEGFSLKRKIKSESIKMNRLKRENDKLMKIVAEKKLRLQIQSEMQHKSISKEDRKIIATEYIKEGHSKKAVLDVLGISRSSYYYYQAKGEAGEKGQVNGWCSCRVPV